MKKTVNDEINRFVGEDHGNRLENKEGHYFDQPLHGFAAADDQVFAEFKEIIGKFHQTPEEILPGARTVICWILPIVRSTRESNRREHRWPSSAWAHTRSFGESFNNSLRRHLVAWLIAKGYKAIAPQLATGWQQLDTSPVGIASTWSERHAAYAAGLGTFSLNDGFITRKGIAHRIGSVITDLELTADHRPYENHTANCLYHSQGKCGVCISRCPVGALSEKGHDKISCCRICL